jgi:tRNA isopentenyltransferase (miaA)
LKDKEQVLVIIGPTAVGKTKTGILLAKRFDGEIISGDSMQVYRGMDIGTAKVTKDEMEGIPHHLIDIRDPQESFSVAEYQILVRKKIGEISGRGKLPILVGGTGLYIQAVLFDYNFSAGYNPSLRKRLQKEADELGYDELYRRLSRIDPETAAQLHPNNIRRIIRALEVFEETGLTMTEWRSRQRGERRYHDLIIGLTMEREKLYRRIDERIDSMMEKGLLEEAKRLYDRGLAGCQAAQAIGYKELFDYFEGKVTLAEAIEQIKRNTRRFAKRQLTWFKNKMDVHWFDLTDEEDYGKIFEKISHFVEGMLDRKSNMKG